MRYTRKILMLRVLKTALETEVFYMSDSLIHVSRDQNAQ